MSDLILKARAFVLKKHNVQTYGDVYPYFKHLEDVYNVLIQFGFTAEYDIDILLAGWLHDCMEDCPVSFNDVKKEFDENIAEIVFCVTDELGRNRKERKAKTYPKIRSNAKAIIVKVADRIANAEFSKSQKSPQYGMYVKEFPDFQKNLQGLVEDARHRLLLDVMWNHLQKILTEESKK